jgi:glutamine synthetase
MEAATLLEMIQTTVFPAIETQISRVSAMVTAVQSAGKGIAIDRLEDIKAIYEKLLKAEASLEVEYVKASEAQGEEEKAHLLSHIVLPQMGKVRELADEAEGLVADESWPLPKYREILFLR